MIRIDERLGDSQTANHGAAERRVMPRINKRFPTRVQGGVDGSGELFDISTELDNISAGGLYVRLPIKVDVGTRLALTVRFSEMELTAHRPPLLALHGTVRRTERRPDGLCGVAVEFNHHIFL